MITLPVRLTRLVFACLILGGMALTAPLASSGQSQPPRSLSARRFNIVLRVVRPKWRDADTVPMPIHPASVTGTQFTIKNAESDEEFLKELRVNNAFFTFDGVVNKRVLTLRGDQGWQAPADFSRQKLWVGVVDVDREMLRIPDADTKLTAQKGVATKLDGSPVVEELPAAYSFDLTEKVQQDLLQKHMFILCFRFTQFHETENGPVSYISGNMIHFMTSGQTTCIVGASLPVVDRAGNIQQGGNAKNLTLLSSDVIFATVTEIK